ncbi:MAG: Gfo/Idh/MocA family oxidoreductase [Planctomycetes bacterium]|nr:Gfo/Idh/MocA family oxidoreductase [Planctomycetota bacterium]
MKSRHERWITRRNVLKGAAKAAGAAVAFPYIVPSSALGLDGAVAPSNRITVGCIGTGGMGTYDMTRMFEVADVQVVAVCDPKQPKREAARARANEFYKKDVCAAYNDFRELVVRKDIDVVQVATVDQWHVPCALAAVRSGKDVYVEKPLGMSLQEIKMLREACHRYGRIFQFGTQQRSMPQFRQACELAINGRLGKLHTIKVSAPSGHAERTGDVTYVPAPVPAGFDYDMWLGPAPWAPYTPKRTESPHWFHISDYSLGYIAGWGIHHVDIAQWGNGTELTGPIEVEGSGVFPSKDSLCDNPLNWDAKLKYASGVVMHFTSDGGPNQHGIRFEGTRGWVHVDRGQIIAEPRSLLDEKIGPDETRLPVSLHQQRNLIECVKTRGRTVSNIDVAVRSDAICHLTWLAVHLGRKLRWNPDKEEFVNDPEANARMVRVMRAPWHL